VPEHEVVSCEWLAVGPLHTLAEFQDERATVVLKLIALCDVGNGLFTGVVPEEQAVWTRHSADAIPAIARARETAAPSAAVATDLMNRLYDQGLIRQSLFDRWQFALLDQVRQGWCFGELLGKLRGIGDNAGSFEFAD